MTERPKFAKEHPVWVAMTCRVCKAELEAYLEAPLPSKKEPDLYNLAFQMAGTMRTHLIEAHGYSKDELIPKT